MTLIDGHQVTSFQGRNGSLSYKLKLIAKKSIPYRCEFGSPGSSTPLGRWPGEHVIKLSIRHGLKLHIRHALKLHIGDGLKVHIGHALKQDML